MRFSYKNGKIQGRLDAAKEKHPEMRDFPSRGQGLDESLSDEQYQYQLGYVDGWNDWIDFHTCEHCGKVEDGIAEDDFGRCLCDECYNNPEYQEAITKQAKRLAFDFDGTGQDQEAYY